MPDEPSSLHAIDRFLAACVRSHCRSEAPPAFPEALAQRPREVAERVCFHGIALLLWTGLPGLAQWPAGLRESIGAEARAQSFWETAHRLAVSEMIEALAKAGISAIVTKGTALAYSVYGDPALRRRGDTDILVKRAELDRARSALSRNGFRRVGSRQSLQETWHKSTQGGFAHEIDLHWRIRGSAAISGHLEESDIAARTIPLPRLANAARGIAPLGNLVLTALNRADHEVFGYTSDERTLFEGDRLIWAVDIDLVASRLGEEDWSALVETARRIGCAPQLLSGLLFARDCLASDLPDTVIRALGRDRGSPRLQEYLATRSAFRRMVLDIAAARNLAERSDILARHLFPGEERLRKRFPHAANWPLALLHARRLAGAAARSLRRAA